MFLPSFPALELSAFSDNPEAPSSHLTIPPQIPMTSWPLAIEATGVYSRAAAADNFSWYSNVPLSKAVHSSCGRHTDESSVNNEAIQTKDAIHRSTLSRVSTMP